MLIELAVVSGGAVLWRKLKPKGNKRSKVVARSQSVSVRNKKTTKTGFKGKQLVSDLKSVLLKDERRELQKTIDPAIDRVDDYQKRRSGKNMLLSTGGATVT